MALQTVVIAQPTYYDPVLQQPFQNYVRYKRYFRDTVFYLFEISGVAGAFGEVNLIVDQSFDISGTIYVTGLPFLTPYPAPASATDYGTPNDIGVSIT